MINKSTLEHFNREEIENVKSSIEERMNNFLKNKNFKERIQSLEHKDNVDFWELFLERSRGACAEVEQ